MSADAPHMNPATKGNGTNRAEFAAPIAPRTICATPAIATVAPAIATIGPAPCVAGASAGSAASAATRLARMSVVAAAGPLPGWAAPPSRPAIRWPQIADAKPA